MIIKGKAMVLGDNVSTDHIIAGKYCRLADVTELARHLFEGTKAQNRVGGGTILVAGKCFGCGSSREQAPLALKAAGVRAVLAESFGRIFYRNAVNLGIPVLVCPGIHKWVKNGDVLQADLFSGKIANETTGTQGQAQPLSDYVMKILESGGIKLLIKSQYGRD